MNHKNDIANNLYHFYDVLSKNLDQNSGKNQTISWVKNKPGYWPNMIYNTQFSPLDKKSLITPLIEQQKKGHLPPFWLVLNNELGIQLGEQLKKQGLREILQWSGMALTKDTYASNLPVNSTINSKQIETPLELEQWVMLLNKELFSSQQVESALFLNLLENPNFKLYGAYLNDELVASTLSFYDENSCGLYMIATKTSFRKQGIATTLIQYTINKALEQGFSTVVLHATKAGEGVYKKIGFNRCCTFSIYWRLEIGDF